jgi:hypothetical protein
VARLLLGQGGGNGATPYLRIGSEFDSRSPWSLRAGVLPLREPEFRRRAGGRDGVGAQTRRTGRARGNRVGSKLADDRGSPRLIRVL